MAERAETPIEDPQARLERAFINAFLREHGCDLGTLNRRPPDERRALLSRALLYAASKLAEIDARAAYVHELHATSRE